MEYKLKPNYTFPNLPIEPFHSWLLDLYDVMKDQTFTIQDMKFCLDISGDEAFSLLSYMIIDCKCVTSE
jgi:hypothetical protein